MSWFGHDRDGMEAAARRRSPAAAPAPAATMRRGPIIRTSDFVSRPSSIAREPAAVVTPVEVKVEPAAQPETVAVRTATPVAAAAVDSPKIAIMDSRSLLQAVWRHRRILMVLTVAGAVVGALAMPLLPRKFTAITSLYFDPRQIQFSDDSQAPSFNKDAFLAVVDSQTKILISKKVLGKAVTQLEASNDPAFAANAGSTGDLVAGLERAVKIVRDDDTYVVNLSVSTPDPQRSAAIANNIVSAFMEEESAAASGLYNDTNSILDGRIDELAVRLQEAEKAVETYKADNDMVTADGGFIADKRLVALNELLVAAQNRTIEAKARADAVSGLKFEDMVAGTQPDDVSSATLANLRRQYGTAAASVGSLESQLGARHPQLLAAKASLNGLSGEIRRELQRFASIAQSDLQQARKAEEDVAKELTVQKALQTNTSVRLIELNELQRKAAAVRDIYEALLKRTRQTSEEKSLLNSNIRVISAAEAPPKADGPGRSILLVAGAFGGGVLGLGLGIVYAVIRLLSGNAALRRYFADFNESRTS